MWLRKLVLKWLFNYSTPKYYEAIQFYKNIKWVELKDYGKKYIHNNTIVMHEMKENNGEVWWYFYDSGDPNNIYNSPLSNRADTYDKMIVYLHRIIHFGLITAKE